MNTTYEHKNELTFIGFHTEIAPNGGYKKCPEFWDKEYAAKYARLWQTMKSETAVETEDLLKDNHIGGCTLFMKKDKVEEISLRLEKE